MKTSHSFILIIAFLAAACGNKMLKEADAHYRNDEFAAAARIYENILQTDSSNIVMLHLADCYRQMNRDAQAEKWYSRSVNSPDATPKDELHYADVLKKNGKYSEAQKWYGFYLTSQPGDQVAQNQSAFCNSPARFSKPDPFYVVEPFLSGFDGSCFSPTQWGNNLIITAEAPVKTGDAVNPWTGKGFLDLYVVSFQETDVTLQGSNFSAGETTNNPKITSLPGDVNSSLHDGPAVVSPDGHTLYFTRSAKKCCKNKIAKAKNNDNHLELCSADLVDGKWTNIKSLSFNSPEFSCGQPAISANGTRLYFVSDIPGGLGGTDIYYSDISNGVWGNPVNAGSTINTTGNEMFPTFGMASHVQPVMNGDFYFSSDGWSGAGGLDIFHCSFTNGSLSSPERLAFPFNSNSDDFGIIFTKDGNEGYFSSNRGNETGTDMIYHFRKVSPRFFVQLDVRMKGKDSVMAGTEVKIENSRSGEIQNMVTDKNGRIVFEADSLTNYGLTIAKDGYFKANGYVNTDGFEGRMNDTSFVKMNIIRIFINTPIRLDNIYYDYNKWNIRPDAALILDSLAKVMTDNPKIRIELSSHTDSRGTDADNMKLSMKRSQSAVDYIVSKGISRDRISAKVYGESMPLNLCIDGVICSEAQYQLNRRTAFIVVKITQ